MMCLWEGFAHLDWGVGGNYGKLSSIENFPYMVNPPLCLSSKLLTFHSIFRQYRPIEIREKYKNKVMKEGDFFHI